MRLLYKFQKQLFMKNLLFLLAAFILFTSETCERGVAAGGYDQPAESYVTVKTTGCFGTCPIYEFTIKGNGESTYNGDRFVDVEGEKTKTFSSEKTNALFGAFEGADYWSFEDKYSGNVTDLPSTFLTYSHGGQTKKIVLYYNVPEQLVGLSKLAKSFANSENWVRGENKN